MIGTLFRVEVEPAKRQAFIDFIEEDIRVAKEREPGTLRFDMYEDPKDENAFYVYEAYRDQKAFDEHKKNEPFQHWESHIRAEMVTRFESFFEQVEAARSSAT
jgi:autoinducer 2-degrading protein